MRFWRSAICSVGPPLRLATMTSLTMPLASDSAFTEQIISSRQPFPTSVLLTPTTYCPSPSPPPPPPAVPPSSSLPQAAAINPRTAKMATSYARLRVMPSMPSLLSIVAVPRQPLRRADPSIHILILRCPYQSLPVAAGVIAVGRLEQRLGPFLTDHRWTADHGRESTALEQQLRGLHLDLIDDRGVSDRRARSHRRVHLVESHQRVSRWGADIDDDVGVVEQPRSGCGSGGHCDHRDAPLSRSDRNLDRDGGETARTEHHHHVGRSEREVAENLLGESLDAL